MATTVGERIKQVREELGLKPVEFAREIGAPSPNDPFQKDPPRDGGTQ